MKVDFKKYDHVTYCVFQSSLSFVGQFTLLLNKLNIVKYKTYWEHEAYACVYK